MKTTKTTHWRRIAPRDAAQDHRAIIARRLDLLAGIELQHGHHLAAERLAHQAAELREVSQ